MEARRAVGDIPIYYHHRDTLEVATFDAVQDQEENAAAIDDFYDPAFPTANLVAGVKQRDSAKRILNAYVERRNNLVKIDEEARKARLAKQVSFFRFHLKIAHSDSLRVTERSQRTAAEGEGLGEEDPCEGLFRIIRSLLDNLQLTV